MLLAELLVRHTRRHMPTRRVALGSSYLPMAGRAAPGALLVGAIASEFAGALDSDDREELDELIRVAGSGLDVPRIAVRHRLQRDTHGLDRSRHRVEHEAGRLVIELDTHGNALPNLLGAVLAVGVLPASARHPGLLAIRQAIRGHKGFTLAGAPHGTLIRRLTEGTPHEVPWAPGAHRKPGRPPAEVAWIGIPAEQRWAMEVLGMRAEVVLDREEINRRYRRLLREAHPDTSAPDTSALRRGAAERIAELTDARELLLDFVIGAGAPIPGAPAPSSPQGASAPTGTHG